MCRVFLFNGLGMKFFALISLLAALLLGLSSQLGLLQTKPPSRETPLFLKNYQRKVKERFHKPENANLLFSFITGNKNGISPYTKKAFKRVNLSFLLSPSGVHLSGFLFIIGFFLKRIKVKWIRKTSQISILSSGFMFTNFDSIKRLIILRLLFHFKFLSKVRISLEMIFFLAFFLSFLLGDFSTSPLGFIYSFLFLGTFFSLRNYPKIILILGLFSTQLILGLFLGEKVSLVAIPIGLIGSFIFSLLFPLLLIFLGSFWLIPINWGEPIISYFVAFVRIGSKLLNGSFTSSSIFLIVLVWVLFLAKFSKRKCTYVIILIFLHTNTAMTPVIFS